jgi:hypothetical protein
MLPSKRTSSPLSPPVARPGSRWRGLRLTPCSFFGKDLHRGPPRLEAGANAGLLDDQVSAFKADSPIAAPDNVAPEMVAIALQSSLPLPMGDCDFAQRLG